MDGRTARQPGGRTGRQPPPSGHHLAKLNPRLAWDDQTYLLADIRDSLAFLAWTKTKEASRKGARWRGQLQRPGTVRHEATGGEAVAMDDEQLAAYLAAPRTTIREA